ncbi:MAG: VanW family protein [Clostridiales bacterium]|nr:VanW family protein [Clostridiales bacterium]
MPCVTGALPYVSAENIYSPVQATDQKQSESGVKIIIVAGNKEFEYIDRFITPSDFTVAEQIERRRINAPLEQKIELIDEYIRNGADYKTAITVCFPLIERTVDEIARFLYVPPENSEVVYKNKRFTATESKSGRALDENRLYGSMYYAVKYGAFDKIKAATVEIAPNLTQSELKSKLVLRGAYTTEYYSSTDARAHNVALASSKFDGLRLEPGQTLSFNETVGERTEENGFRKAKIIVNGEYTDGVGGGACQASTAIYNAALSAGLNVIANAHSICPSYCPPGLDAMISSASDMRIINNTDNDVYFSVTNSGKKTRIEIYGEKNEYYIEAQSEIVERIDYEQHEFTDSERKYFDESADSGDRLLVAPGRCGYVSSTYLVYYKDGKPVKRVKIRSNTYKPTPQITAVAP